MLGDKDLLEANNRLVGDSYMLLLLLEDQLIGIDWYPSKLSYIWQAQCTCIDNGNENLLMQMHCVMELHRVLHLTLLFMLIFSLTWFLLMTVHTTVHS